jgi:hypothetical protein
MLWSSIKHLQWFSIYTCTVRKHYISFIAYIMLITRVQEVQIILFLEKEVRINIPTFSWNIDMEELVNISIFNIKHNMVVNNHWWYLFLTSMTVSLLFSQFPHKKSRIPAASCFSIYYLIFEYCNMNRYKKNLCT